MGRAIPLWIGIAGLALVCAAEALGGIGPAVSQWNGASRLWTARSG